MISILLLIAGAEMPNPAPQDFDSYAVLQEACDRAGGLPKGAVSRLGSPFLRHPGRIYPITDLFYSPSAATVSTLREWRLRQWNLVTGKRCDQDLAIEDNGGIFAVAYSPRGDKLAVVSGDVKVYEFNKALPIVLTCPADDAWKSVAFGGNSHLLLVGGVKGEIYLWSIGEKKQMWRKKYHADRITTLSVDHAGRYFLSGGSDGLVVLSELASGRILHRWKEHTDWVMKVAISPDGIRAASIAVDQKLNVFDLDSKTLSYSYRPGDLAKSNSIAFSPDGKVLACATLVPSIRFLETRTGSVLKEVQAPIEYYSPLVFSPDGKVVGWVRGDVVNFTDVKTGKLYQVHRGHFTAVRWFALADDGKTCTSVSHDGTVCRGDIFQGRQNRGYELNRQELVLGALIAVSDNGRVVLVGSNRRLLTVYDEKGTKLAGFAVPDDVHITSVCSSHDGRRIAAGTREKTLLVWDIVSGKRLSTATQHSGEINAIAFSWDGKTLASASNDIAFWNTTEERLVPIRGNLGSNQAREGYWALALSVGAKKRAAARLLDGRVEIWDWESGARVSVCNAEHAGGSSIPESQAIALRPDGQVIASANEDGTISCYDTATGRLLGVRAGHEGPVNAVRFTPDGKHLVSSGQDGLILVWNGF